MKQKAPPSDLRAWKWDFLKLIIRGWRPQKYEHRDPFFRHAHPLDRVWFSSNKQWKAGGLEHLDNIFWPVRFQPHENPADQPGFYHVLESGNVRDTKTVHWTLVQTPTRILFLKLPPDTFCCSMVFLLVTVKHNFLKMALSPKRSGIHICYRSQLVDSESNLELGMGSPPALVCFLLLS